MSVHSEGAVCKIQHEFPTETLQVSNREGPPWSDEHVSDMTLHDITLFSSQYQGPEKDVESYHHLTFVLEMLIKIDKQERGGYTKYPNTKEALKLLHFQRT